VGYPIIRTYRVICDAGVSWTFLQRLIWNRPIDPTFVWKATHARASINYHVHVYMYIRACLLP